MAQAISLISGSPLIGSPIVYRVVPAAYGDNRTFHRIIVRVYAKLETDEDYTTFDFSTPVETKTANGVTTTQPSLFDISSALQAVADKYAYAATPPERYPYIQFRIEAWDEWMIDGTIYPEQDVVQWPSLPVGQQQFYGYAFMGAWTDLERMNAVESEGVEYLDTLQMSRKPTSSPEIVFTGCEFIYPDEFLRSILDTDYMSEGADPRFVSGAPDNGPRSLTYTPQADGAATIGGHNIYAVPLPAERGYQLRFINGLGCMESLCVQSLVKRETNITTAKHAVARQETLKKFSRSVVRKSNDRETWALTSGPLDEQWASWYIHEFLMAEQIWIGLNSHTSSLSPQTIWLPCHVVPEETTVLEDREKAQPLEVQFRLEMDINGSPM
jgi:hypothetical protein